MHTYCATSSQGEFTVVNQRTDVFVTEGAKCLRQYYNNPSIFNNQVYQLAGSVYLSKPTARSANNPQDYYSNALGSGFYSQLKFGQPIEF